MAVFRYSATMKEREEHYESGTVIADDERGAQEKLKQLDMINVKLKRLEGISGFLKAFTADVR